MRNFSHKYIKYMELSKKYWLVGHLLTPIMSTENYDMVIGITPGKVQGPPPHFHSGLTEFFMVLEGDMEFILAGEKKLLKKNDFVTIPPNTVHTFSNPGDSPNKWLNIHDPVGWLELMKAFGVPDDIENAQSLSTSQAQIENLIKNAALYDMHLL